MKGEYRPDNDPEYSPLTTEQRGAINFTKRPQLQSDIYESFLTEDKDLRGPELPSRDRN